MKSLRFYNKTIYTGAGSPSFEEKREAEVIDPLRAYLEDRGPGCNFLKTDFMGELNWVNESEDFGFGIVVSNYASELAFVFRSEQWNISEIDLLELAKMIVADLEEWGWVDVDPVHWRFNIGSTFHGIPEDHDMIHGIIDGTELAERDLLWLAVTIVDRAS